MQRIRSILVYVDSRPEAINGLRTAEELARRTGASVNVMDVVDDAMLLASHPELAEESVGSRMAALEALVAPLRRELAVTTTVARGTVSLELIRQVLRQRPALVIKTARGTERGRPVFFGTTAMHLIRKCPCPVWLVSPEPAAERPRIVAAVNPRSEGGGMRLALKVLDQARALARHLGGDLRVVHAWYPAAVDILRRRASAEELDRYVTDVEAEAREAFEDLLAVAPNGTVPETHHLLRGSPEEVIPEFARHEGADAIVMGSVGRAGIAGLLVGEMAEEILNRVRCGVLCVKPDGFVSPVGFADVTTEAPTVGP